MAFNHAREKFPGRSRRVVPGLRPFNFPHGDYTGDVGAGQSRIDGGALPVGFIRGSIVRDATAHRAVVEVDNPVEPRVGFGWRCIEGYFDFFGFVVSPQRAIPIANRAFAAGYCIREVCRCQFNVTAVTFCF